MEELELFGFIIHRYRHNGIIFLHLGSIMIGLFSNNRNRWLSWKHWSWGRISFDFGSLHEEDV